MSGPPARSPDDPPGGRESGPPVTGHDAALFWESRYGGEGRIWSGKPNDALVETAAGIDEVGRALDLGCGEGGDSV